MNLYMRQYKGRWVTVGAQDTGEGERKGGTPMFIEDDGTVSKGPLKGKRIGAVDKGVEGTPAEKRSPPPGSGRGWKVDALELGRMAGNELAETGRQIAGTATQAAQVAAQVATSLAGAAWTAGQTTVSVLDRLRRAPGEIGDAWERWITDVDAALPGGDDPEDVLSSEDNILERVSAWVDEHYTTPLGSQAAASTWQSLQYAQQKDGHWEPQEAPGAPKGVPAPPPVPQAAPGPPAGAGAPEELHPPFPWDKARAEPYRDDEGSAVPLDLRR